MPAKPLSLIQKADAERLKGLFTRWKEERKAQKLEYSQEWCSAQFGIGQSAFSQYLNGKIPLNPEASVKFARMLGLRVEDFSSDMQREIERVATFNDSSQTGVKIAPAPIPFPATAARPTPRQLLGYLNQYAERLTEAERKFLGAGLDSMVTQPGNSDRIVETLATLLGEIDIQARRAM